MHWDALAGGRAAFLHDAVARRAVHALKYGHVRAIAPAMATHIAAAAGELNVDVAFAVPLHPSRARRRGYNQSEELLFHAGLPRAPGTLRRIRKTDSQVGLGLEDRRANVRGAFAYEGSELTGLRVALVDDVITTGATANECARVLRDFGAREVWVVAFARADPAAAHGGDA
jgi:ComF family protein